MAAQGENHEASHRCGGGHSRNLWIALFQCTVRCGTARRCGRPSAVAAVDDPGVLAADRAFVQAFAKGDSAAAAKLLDYELHLV
ncbi:MAG TPA: hypothetical protein VNE63_20915 [Candidatus Acidoferrales bacterium]|nr:hypothetical protein [Candidatus Acidoferrales bacterium]